MSNQQWGPPPVQQPQYPPQQQSWGAPPPSQYAGPPGPPQYQQGFGWGQLPPQKKKKKRGCAVVAGVLGGLLLLGVAGLVIAVNVVRNDRPTVTSPVYTPTSGATQPPPLPTRQTALPTRQPTRPVPTTRPTTKRPTPNQVLTANRIYKTGVQRPMGCRESKAGLSTGAKAGQYYRQIKLCLDRAWPRQIVAAGEKWRAPNMLVFAGTANSPCGSISDGRSFYCQSSHTIYMNSPLHVSFFRTNPAFGRAAATFTVAHEYGHAMQSLLGILSSNAWLQYEANGAKKLELNRRMELQASCLGSVFSGANKGSYGLKGQLYTQYLYILNTSGDENARGGPRDHGNRANHGYWSRRGFASPNPAVCNTFVAPAGKVS